MSGVEKLFLGTLRGVRVSLKASAATLPDYFATSWVVRSRNQAYNFITH